MNPADERFVRFQSAVPNKEGRYPGFFSLLRGLAVGGALTDADLRWWKLAIARSYELHDEPTSVDPHCYDRPGARTWYRCGADDLIELAAAGCQVLDRYHVPWIELRTHYPGHLTYHDAVQVVAVPYSHETDWRIPAPLPDPGSPTERPSAGRQDW